MKENKLIPHLFRTEYSKIVSVLCKTFGLENIEVAQDFVSDSFLKAAETWKLHGIPDNPKAWLYTVSKNNAKDYFKRDFIFKTKITPELSKKKGSQEIEIDLSDRNIKDSQLQMLFAICNPIISSESQIALALRILCGFGIEEIANALLSTKQTINKRLYRAKEKLRANQISLSFPPTKELELRLDNVLSILYLLFNEGYYSSTADKTISKELCLEAMRMLHLLTENKGTSIPKVNALMSLFCFQASRLDARTNAKGEQILYNEQDKKKWNFELIAQGEIYLNKSAKENLITKYHLEALIAYWHTRTTYHFKEKWQNILQLYNRLLQIEYSPVTALNRTYALAMAEGKTPALKEALKIDLTGNHLYQALLAELYEGLDTAKHIEHLNLAIQQTKNKEDILLLKKKLNLAKK
ncbi:sigma-70 family RNA polymerase sigma factor [uncultured Maribacter sp.]|uniref:RNA polymerase sigma factor n=1 Tax=uncultured Maribacter sp. TaxID=431308 RepID=UPI0026384042|nr:sigma-70 family RNA polymerase sigma factor [uncultured Maribacter sp.]